jgi:hypothetical protein
VGLLLQAVLDIEILDIEIVTASRFLTLPQKLSRADKSGVVFVAAHGKDPNYSSQALIDVPLRLLPFVHVFGAPSTHEWERRRKNNFNSCENCSFHLE